MCSSDLLSEAEIALVRRWIEQGAKNDWQRSSENYSAEHPPTYSRLPTITSLDFSPDGKTLAVPGNHEVLLLDAQSGQLMRRLIGATPRVESVRFSPDGMRLAVAGGLPGEAGELQVWNAVTGDLIFSSFVSHDTIFGASWSPDSKRIVYRAAHPTDPAEVERYKDLLAQHLVEPGQLEIFVMNADGSGQRPVT